MACVPCWQQRQMFVAAMRQGSPLGMMQAARTGVHIATDKYIRGIDVNRKYAPPQPKLPVYSYRSGPRVR